MGKVKMIRGNNEAAMAFPLTTGYILRIRGRKLPLYLHHWAANAQKARLRVSQWLDHERDDVTRIYLASVLKERSRSE